MSRICINCGRERVAHSDGREGCGCWSPTAPAVEVKHDGFGWTWDFHGVRYREALTAARARHGDYDPKNDCAPDGTDCGPLCWHGLGASSKEGGAR